MKKVVVDSCILIDHLRGVPEAALYLESLVSPAISRITWMEVLAGAPSADAEAVARTLLDSFEMIPLDDVVAEEAVRCKRTHRVKLPDAIILASAIVTGRNFATRNTKDFRAGERGIVIPYAL